MQCRSWVGTVLYRIVSYRTYISEDVAADSKQELRLVTSGAYWSKREAEGCKYPPRGGPFDTVIGYIF